MDRCGAYDLRNDAEARDPVYGDEKVALIKTSAGMAEFPVPAQVTYGLFVKGVYLVHISSGMAHNAIQSMGINFSHLQSDTWHHLLMWFHAE